MYAILLLFSDLKDWIWPSYVSEQTTSYCFRKYCDTEHRGFYLVFILVASEPDLSKVQQHNTYCRSTTSSSPQSTLLHTLHLTGHQLYISRCVNENEVECEDIAIMSMHKMTVSNQQKEVWWLTVKWSLQVNMQFVYDVILIF